jgi:hypothetical protein
MPALDIETTFGLVDNVQLGFNGALAGNGSVRSSKPKLGPSAKEA